MSVEVSAQALRKAMADGGAAVAAWADVLDRINVFPVADGDTGRNLLLSFGPLRDLSASDETTTEKLLLSARGNSGNIGCAFARALLDATAGVMLAQRFAVGADRARQAVADPQPGTMLTVLDALAESAREGLSAAGVPSIVRRLTEVVNATQNVQESLRRARVVDSGALGMLVFVDGLLRSYFGCVADEALASSFQALVRFDRKKGMIHGEHGVCVDAVLDMPAGKVAPDELLAGIGTEVVALREGRRWKIHLHAEDAARAKARLAELGEVVAWSWDDLAAQVEDSPTVAVEGQVHVVTDGAASLSRRHANALGVTLLDSYVDVGGRSLPETRLDPDDVYRAMRRGLRVSTAQASTFERHLCYRRLSAQWPHVLYLCVGSAYTGNCAVAQAWCNEPDGKIPMTVVDSGAASGRLAVMVRAVALAARQGDSPASLAALAVAVSSKAEEYIFVEKLVYLARSGRLSKTGAWFADAVGLAPVVAPYPDGVRKVALLRTAKARVAFATERVRAALGDGAGHVLLQYTDNRAWVEDEVLPRLQAVAPAATVEAGPLSLTTGVHTGPGTWAVAVLPDA